LGRTPFNEHLIKGVDLSVCTSLRTRLTERLATIQAQLIILNDAYLGAISTDLESYTFDSAEARQQAKTRSPEELWKLIQNMQATEDSICRKLNGTSVMSINLRRKLRG